MHPDTEDTIFDMIEEAAKDVLKPMIDQEVLTCSVMDVTELARRIMRRTMELMDVRDGGDQYGRIDLNAPIAKTITR